jgi:hypothetical protein
MAAQIRADAEHMVARGQLSREDANRNLVDAGYPALDQPAATGMAKSVLTPEPAAPKDAPAAAPQPAGPVPNLPLQFPKDAPGAVVVAAHEVAQETIAALGVDADLARGGVAMLEKSIGERQGKAMDEIELASMDFRLKEMWGPDYDARMDAVQAAFRKAGRGGEWLRQAVLASGPLTAAWVFDSLSRHGR